MTITATKVLTRDLRPGDLFSTRGPEYWRPPARPYMGGWSFGRDPSAVGERVYIRTEAPCPADQEAIEVFRIEVARALDEPQAPE